MIFWVMIYPTFVKNVLYRVIAVVVVARSVVAQRHPPKIEICALLIEDDRSFFKLYIAFFGKVL